MLQYAIFFVSVLRAAPLGVLIPGLDGHWLTRLGQLFN
jgi:hypothetical protein